MSLDTGQTRICLVCNTESSSLLDQCPSCGNGDGSEFEERGPQMTAADMAAYYREQRERGERLAQERAKPAAKASAKSKRSERAA